MTQESLKFQAAEPGPGLLPCLGPGVIRFMAYICDHDGRASASLVMPPVISVPSLIMILILITHHYDRHRKAAAAAAQD